MSTTTAAPEYNVTGLDYRDRADPNWQRRTAEQAEEIFAGLGLVGDFWKLSPPPASTELDQKR